MDKVNVNSFLKLRGNQRESLTIIFISRIPNSLLASQRIVQPVNRVVLSRHVSLLNARFYRGKLLCLHTTLFTHSNYSVYTHTSHVCQKSTLCPNGTLDGSEPLVDWNPCFSGILAESSPERALGKDFSELSRELVEDILLTPTGVSPFRSIFFSKFPMFYCL